jgi:hypothetical protein
MVKTWGGKKTFKYDGCVLTGTVIHYGNGYKFNITVTAQQYAALRRHFLGSVIKVGTSRTSPPPGSLGVWLNHLKKTGIASYVAPILVREGYAVKESGGLIRIIR